MLIAVPIDFLDLGHDSVKSQRRISCHGSLPKKLRELTFHVRRPINRVSAFSSGQFAAPLGGKLTSRRQIWRIMRSLARATIFVFKFKARFRIRFIFRIALRLHWQISSRAIGRAMLLPFRFCAASSGDATFSGSGGELPIFELHPFLVPSVVCQQREAVENMGLHFGPSIGTHPRPAR